MRVSTLAFAFAFALALGPQAAAHIEAFSQAKLVTVGPYNAAVEPKPSPIFANGALSMSALFTKADDGSYVTRGIDPSLEVVDGNGTTSKTPMQSDPTGYYVAAVAFDKPGNYSVSLVVKDGSGTYANASNFTVYPDLPLRFRSEDPRQPDPVRGEPYVVSILSLDPDNGLPMDKGLTDLTLTLEHWSLDHTVIYFENAYPMKHAGAGRWTLQHTFDTEGMFHLRFASASGGFKNDDVPILHVNALTPTPGTPNRVPLGVLVPVAAVALAVVLARRSR